MNNGNIIRPSISWLVCLMIYKSSKQIFQSLKDKFAPIFKHNLYPLLGSVSEIISFKCYFTYKFTTVPIIDHYFTKNWLKNFHFQVSFKNCRWIIRIYFPFRDLINLFQLVLSFLKTFPKNTSGGHLLFELLRCFSRGFIFMNKLSSGTKYCKFNLIWLKISFRWC